MPNPEVRYCTTEDGVRIAYCVEGEGPVVIYLPSFVDSFVSRLNYVTDSEIHSALAEGRSVVYFDHRGVGLSQREVADFSVPDLILDVDAVARSLDRQRFSILASTIAGPIAVAYAAQYADRVSHLVLLETFADVREVMSAEQLSSLAELCRTNWQLGAQVFADLSAREQHPDVALEVARGIVAGATGTYMARLIEAGLDFDGAMFLESIAAETLVLHQKGDPVIPFSAGQRLAAGIPRARLLPIEGSSAYSTLSDDTAMVIDAITEFLPKREGVRRYSPSSLAEPVPSFRTILFTDLVGHTEMMQRLGDEKGRDVLREHERITRETLAAHGGAEVKTMGDGFLASFGSVTRAMDCAIALQRAFASQNQEPGTENLHVRVGLNAGEPIEEDGDLFGSTVILASRIAAQAGAGEILIPEPLRHLLSGKSYVYADRGEVALKGFEDAVRLYEVRWRE